MKEEAVVVVAGGACAVAGAQIQVEAGIQVVAEAGGVGVAAVGQGGIDVGGEDAIRGKPEAVCHFGLQTGAGQVVAHGHGNTVGE